MSKKSFSSNTPAEMFISQQAPAAKKGGHTAPEGYRYNYELIETKSRRVQLLMQPSLHEKLKRRAEEQGMSFNNYVHQILENAVEE